MEDRVIILIPAYKPEQSFPLFISNLREKFKYVMIVNDGNDDSYSSIFNRLEIENNCILVHHYTNLGKGRALKSGFNEALHVMKENSNIQGVITADADGQHLIQDIEKVKEALLTEKNKLVLGTRKFNLDKIPFRSRFGNKLTKLVFSWLCGLRINDTQTGLRGIHKNILRQCCTVDGERYEYETNMLLMTKEWGIDIEEVEITTVYENNNSSSHFNPIIDSLKIYKTIFKYSLSSLLSTLIDFLCFNFLINTGVKVFASTYIGRFISAVANFTMNRQLIFKSKGNVLIQIIKYACLVFFSGTISAILVDSVSKLWLVHAIYIKIVVETVLYFFNYYIQNAFIFVKGKKDESN